LLRQKRGPNFNAPPGVNISARVENGPKYRKSEFRVGVKCQFSAARFISFSWGPIASSLLLIEV
jgi:hypothetical protein